MFEGDNNRGTAILGFRICCNNTQQIANALCRQLAHTAHKKRYGYYWYGQNYKLFIIYYYYYYFN